ncbi:MAG: hypothetical protein AAFX03_01065 [Pseudomonadota bacterium]
MAVMTPAEIINLQLMANQTSAIIITGAFTLVFGYIGSLYFFIRHTAFHVRALAFAIYSLSLFFLYWAIFGLNLQWYNWIHHLYKSAEAGVWTSAMSVGRERLTRMVDIGFYTTNTVFATAWLAALYLTFLYGWRTKEERAARATQSKQA